MVAYPVDTLLPLRYLTFISIRYITIKNKDRSFDRKKCEVYGALMLVRAGLLVQLASRVHTQCYPYMCYKLNSTEVFKK
jgi:hypothetical protein